MVKKGDIVYILVSRKSKRIMGVFGNEVEAKNTAHDIEEDDIQILKRVFGYSIYQ